LLYAERFWCSVATVEQRARSWPRTEKSRAWCARRIGGIADGRLRNRLAVHFEDGAEREWSKLQRERGTEAFVYRQPEAGAVPTRPTRSARGQRRR
jgi:hypothetical protein